jgi:FAD dependent oxidoreductase
MKTADRGTGPRLRPDQPARSAPVVVIGAGQAGLSAAYHLQRRGLQYVVLDGEDGPGGAWLHRWPWYPGLETFAGRQLHAAQYVSAAEFAGRHVIVVGGGISAVQLLDEVSRVTTTTRVTRREPAWTEGDFTPETAGRASVARVEADARAGRSIVSYTGLAWTSYALAAAGRGALVRHPMFTAVEPGGVRMADGSPQPADVILWATGFGPAIGHLAPLRLPGDLGGIAVDGTAVAADRRVHLIGYGPSQSTVGANRAGRAAATAVSQLLRAA